VLFRQAPAKLDVAIAREVRLHGVRQGARGPHALLGAPARRLDADVLELRRYVAAGVAQRGADVGRLEVLHHAFAHGARIA
jgi:hypothetical protein